MPPYSILVLGLVIFIEYCKSLRLDLNYLKNREYLQMRFLVVVNVSNIKNYPIFRFSYVERWYNIKKLEWLYREPQSW